MIGINARDRAVAAAELRAAAAAAVLGASTDPTTVDEALRGALGEGAERVAVHGLAAPVGAGRATEDQLRTVGPPSTGDASTAVVPVTGGVAHLRGVPLPGLPAGAVVEVFVPDAELTQGVASRRWLLAGGVTVLLLSLLLAGDRLMAGVGRAARGVAAGARAFGGGENEVRVTPAGPREIAEAGTAFNSMVERVSRQRAAERELIADLSHRLRTPLTALRLEADRARLLGAGPRLTDAVDAMEREVDHLINTARRPYEESAGPEPDRCDAAAVVRERMAFWAAVADDQSRPYRVYGVDTPAPVPLPASELAAALDALLGNVFRYTPQGTAFEVAVSRRDRYVAVRVDDAGPGITTSKDVAIRRGASGKGSTGLGLDIVRRAAVAAGGGVDIDRSALGGTSVVMLLADAEPAPTASRYLLGFVGRLKRDPSERRWRRRARTARESDAI